MKTRNASASRAAMTYREEIRYLDSTATAGPWVIDGELYGVHENGSFLPLGFAPHRPLDSRLIAIYRSAVVELLDALDAVERLTLEAENLSAPMVADIRHVLGVLDAGNGEAISFRSVLAELDGKTTPPLWDPGHLALGMEFGPGVGALGIAGPKPADAPLIAVSRIAVPRALELLGFVEQNIAQYGLRDGRLGIGGVGAIIGAVVAFDSHTAGEGIGTGTV